MSRKEAVEEQQNISHGLEGCYVNSNNTNLWLNMYIKCLHSTSACIFDGNKNPIYHHSYFTALEKFTGVLVPAGHTAGKFWSQNASIYF